jgi:hypothetical protein
MTTLLNTRNIEECFIAKLFVVAKGEENERYGVWVSRVNSKNAYGIYSGSYKRAEQCFNDVTGEELENLFNRKNLK